MRINAIQNVCSVHYPALIGNKSEPGGGTTDYAVDMLRSAGNCETFTCPLKPDTRLPIMYMEDAIKAVSWPDGIDDSRAREDWN